MCWGLFENQVMCCYVCYVHQLCTHKVDAKGRLFRRFQGHPSARMHLKIVEEVRHTPLVHNIAYTSNMLFTTQPTHQLYCRTKLYTSTLLYIQSWCVQHRVVQLLSFLIFVEDVTSTQCYKNEILQGFYACVMYHPQAY